MRTNGMINETQGQLSEERAALLVFNHDLLEKLYEELIKDIHPNEDPELYALLVQLHARIEELYRNIA